MNQATPDGHTMPPVRQRAVNTLTELDRWVDGSPGWDLGAYVGAVLYQADIEGA